MRKTFKWWWRQKYTKTIVVKHLQRRWLEIDGSNEVKEIWRRVTVGHWDRHEVLFRSHNMEFRKWRFVLSRSMHHNWWGFLLVKIFIFTTMMGFLITKISLYRSNPNIQYRKSFYLFHFRLWSHQSHNGCWTHFFDCLRYRRNTSVLDPSNRFRQTVYESNQISMGEIT